MTRVLTERPHWLKKRLISDGDPDATRNTLSGRRLNTVCASSLCPNQNECFSRGQATFLLLGDVCTRGCSFCAAKKGMPGTVDDDEPFRVADAVSSLGLRYAVITSVTRDDLADGGAMQFARTVEEIRRRCGSAGIEVLTPDFRGDRSAIAAACDASPEVFAHNIETVSRLYGAIRSGSGYSRSLELLMRVKERRPSQLTKSSIMVGLGEDAAEIFTAMKDLRGVGCDILTLGQYMRPRPGNAAVARYVAPDEFREYREAALGLGFKYVAAGPFVRSSYLAEEAYRAITGGVS